MKKNSLVALLVVTFSIFSTSVPVAAQTYTPIVAGEAKYSEITFDVDNIGAGEARVFWGASNPVNGYARIPDLDNILVGSLYANGFSLEKSIGLSHTYAAMKRAEMPENIIKGILCQICKEGNPGQLQYKSTSESWKYCTEQQQQYAGKTVRSDKDLIICNSINPKLSIGYGMCQWTADRRTSLLNEYVNYPILDYSTEQLARIEANFILKEFKDPYYARLLSLCDNKDSYYTTDMITKVYIGQTSKYELAVRRSYLPKIESSLNDYKELVEGGVSSL